MTRWLVSPLIDPREPERHRMADSPVADWCEPTASQGSRRRAFRAGVAWTLAIELAAALLVVAIFIGIWLETP